MIGKLAKSIWDVKILVDENLCFILILDFYYKYIVLGS